MKKFYSVLSAFLLCSFFFGYISANAATRSEEFMPAGQVVYPSGNTYVTYIAGLDLSWDYEPLELTDVRDTPNGYDYPCSAVPASLKIEGVEGEINLYPYIYETYLGYEETPDGDYNYIYGYVLSVDFSADDVLGQAKLSEFPYGSYTISFPAGIAKNVLGELNPAQTVELFYLESPDFDTETFFPPAIDDAWQSIDYAADDLSEVSLSWGMPLAFNENSIPATVRQYSWIEETPKTPLVIGENIFVNEDKNALIFNLSTLPVGRWTVEFPTAYVFLGEDLNMINEETMATYTITTASGVSKLDKDMNGRWVVYSIGGELLLDSNKESELKNLRPGLYIINGEKVLIRR